VTDRIRLMIIGAPYKMHLHQALKQCLSERFEVSLVSAEMGYGGRLPILSRRHGIWPLPTKRMIREFVRFHPDIVLTDYPAYPCWYTRFYSLLRRQHIPLLAWLLGDYWTEQREFFATVRFSSKFVYPFALFTWSTGLGFADRILPVCKWLERIVKARVPDKKTSVLHQGIDATPWLVKDDSRFPFKHPAVGILQDNNILPKVRGLLWFAKVAEEMNDVHFYIAGGGPYTHLVKAAFSNLGHVHFVERLAYPEEVRRFYKSVDLYVLPSGLDCCPTTLLEASLCARPAIASQVGGIPELIRQGETGWTLKNGNTDEWVSMIRAVLGSPRLREKTGEKAQQFVINNFAWEKQAAKVISIVEELVDRSRGNSQI
jgi:glycosyltransferase involved in cell wall biosynthesis